MARLPGRLRGCRSCAVVASAHEPLRFPDEGVKLRAEQRRDPVALPAEAEEGFVQRRDPSPLPAEAEKREDQRRDPVSRPAEAESEQGLPCHATEVGVKKGSPASSCAEDAKQTEGLGKPPRDRRTRGQLTAWQREVLKFPRSQFVLSKKFKTVEEAVLQGPGILDLYSGSRGISKACVAAFDSWALTFDIKHHPSQDLSNLSLHGTLARLIRSGAFRAMVAGPVCASFSTAVTPPCRTFQYPAGVPWCSAKQKIKNELGNIQLKFVQRLVRCCLESGTRFAVENPNGSLDVETGGALVVGPHHGP